MNDGLEGKWQLVKLFLNNVMDQLLAARDESSNIPSRFLIVLQISSPYNDYHIPHVEMDQN